MKSLFPKQDWTDLALAEVTANDLYKITPADATEFFLDGSPEAWVHLLAAMAKHESNFKPGLTFNEGGNLAGVVSTGLLQLSSQSVRGYAKFARNSTIKSEMAAATTASLKDPLFNITCAVTILRRWLAADGVVATDASPWLGGARYWSVLRKGATKVKSTMVEARAELADGLGKGHDGNLKPSIIGNLSNGPSATFAGAPSEIQKALAARDRLGSKCNWIFEVDYSINSKLPRLFVYSISENQLYRYKCAHGIGGDNSTPHDGKTREVSNVPNYRCTALGVMRTGARYDSDVVGEALRLHGLSETNSNNLARGIVLHGGSYVEDNEAGTNNNISGRSHGCIVVDDRYIDRNTGGELLEWLRDGSIGVAHYGGSFKIPS